MHFQKINTPALTLAAEKGHLKILKWAIENGCRYSYYEIEYAKIYGYNIPKQMVT